MDVLFTFMKVGIAVDRNKMRITAFEVGPWKSFSFKKINLKIISSRQEFSYEEELSVNADITHVVSKSETCLVKSYNSVLRYYLARLHRKTKCYSKSILMLTLSVKLLLAYKYGLS